MKQRVEFCTNCKELTTQRNNGKGGGWFCEKCNGFISCDASTTVLGNFINKDLKDDLLKKFA